MEFPRSIWRAVSAAAALAVLAAGCASTSEVSDTPGAQIVTAPPTAAAANGCPAALEVGRALSTVDIREPGGVADLAATVAGLAALTPDDLDDDVDVLASALADLAALLDEVGGDASAVEADPDRAARLAALGTPEVEAASANLQSWISAGC